MADWVARSTGVFGCILAASSLGWQVVRDITARKPKVGLQGTLVFSVEPGDDAARALKRLESTGAVGSHWSAVVDVVNLGQVTVQIARFFLKQSTSHGAHAWSVLPPDSEPVAVEPGRSHQGQLDSDAADGFATGVSAVAVVVLATGETFTSAPFGGAHDGVGTLVRLQIPHFEKLTERVEQDTIFRYEVDE